MTEPASALSLLVSGGLLLAGVALWRRLTGAGGPFGGGKGGGRRLGGRRQPPGPGPKGRLAQGGAPGPPRPSGNRKKVKSAKQKAKKQEKKQRKMEAKLAKDSQSFVPAQQSGGARKGGGGERGAPELTEAQESERETVQWNFTYQTTQRDKDIRDRTAAVRGAMKGPGGKKK